MNEEKKPIEEVKPAVELAEQPIKVVSSSSKKIIFNIPLIKRISIIIIVVLLIVGAGVGAYMWRDNTARASEKSLKDETAALKKSKLNLEGLLADEIAKNALINNKSDNTTCIAVSPSETIIDNMILSITAGNTAALEGYMASVVNVILAPSTGTGASSSTQAVTAITNFISSDNNTWAYNFALSDSTLTSYRNGGYGKYFSSISVIGKNAENKVISFSFDCAGKINSVFMATSESLLIK